MNVQAPIEADNQTAIKALVKAQAGMGKALKEATNPHLKKKYADLGNVMDACMPALQENGFAVMQPSGKDDQGLFVDTILAHESGVMFESRVYLVVDKQNMQGVGSAQTYARRYGLMGMAGIAPEDDDGNDAAKAPAKAVTEEQAKELQLLIQEVDADLSKFLLAYGAQSLVTFPSDKFAHAKTALNKKKDQQ